MKDWFREARLLMNEHGLCHWKLRWMESNSAKVCGRCLGGRKLIELNRLYVVHTKTEAVIRNTILHACAHAIDHERRGKSGHDATWRAICAEIGCDGKTKNADAVLPTKSQLKNYGSGTSIEED